MEEIGVEAVVEGLSGFINDIGTINKQIGGIGDTTSILDRALGFVSDTLGGFGEIITNIAEYTIGNLLAGAIRDLIGWLQDLVGSIIEAGSEFQTLEIRLQGMNLDSLIKSGQDMQTALRGATEATKDQFEWLLKLAVLTPYDAKDIANVFTLARSYGFAENQAKTLTVATTDFAAGMGLSNEVLERVIMNLGQMVQRGKITSTEMRDLARGAFLPLDDVLKRIAEHMGMTVEALQREISKPGGGVPAQEFIDAFVQMTQEEPRFVGAAQRMARTFEAAKANALDLVKGIGGLRIVKPVLDALGGGMADFMDQFAGEKFDRLAAAASRIGESLSIILTSILGLGPSAADLADAMVSGLESIGDWLAGHKFMIIDWVKGAVSLAQQGFQTFSNWLKTVAIPAIQKVGDWIMEHVVPALIQLAGWINDSVVPALGFFWNWLQLHILPVLERIGVWLLEHGIPLFEMFADRLIADAVPALQSLGEWIDGTVVPALEKLSQWILDHQEDIATWGARIFEVLKILGVIGAVIGVFLGFIITVGIALAGVIAFIAGLVSIGPIIATIGLLIGAFIVTVLNIKNAFNSVLLVFLTVFNYFASYFRDVLVPTVRQNIDQMIMAIKNRDWAGLGVAMIQGWVRGISANVGWLINAAWNAAMSAYNAALNALGIHSPSKMFEGIGQNMVAGWAQGIINSVGMITGAMNTAVGAAVSAAPAMAGGSGGSVNNISTSIQRTQNMNLTVNSASPREPIIQDFNTMKSLVGG